MEYLDKFVHKEYIGQELKFSEVYHYLDRYMDKEIFTVEELKAYKGGRGKGTIWICWMQGMENAPLIVQKCYESVCRNKPEGVKIVLLTEKNMGEYIQLPDFIWKRYRDGHISKTHLSDLIRLELLCTYGGCWIDATVFCSGAIPDYMVKRDMFLFKEYGMANSVIKMSSWWLAADRHNRILHATRRVIYAYWENEKDIRNYFLLHIIMSKIIDEDTACNVIFRDVPYFNNKNAHVLQGKLGAEYDEGEWGIIKDISVVHKLTYKRKYIQGDVYNYYTALAEDHLR